MSDLHESSGFAAPDPDALAPLFPGYQIQGLIATGGMGAVYRAVQRSLDRTVALKILPMEFSKDAAFCAGFEAEAKAMARLNHANLIGVYDFGEVGGMLYIIMEYVPGQSVYHAAYGQAIEQAEVVRLVTEICNGLAHAHENGIIHRDIKPSNILLDLNGHPKIGDFGLARPADRKVEEGEEIFGTPHYTAPEVVDAPQSVDYRADIFSVGVLLHELLTGRLPASDPRPASVLVGCDPHFDKIVRRATQPLAAARYSSAAEMARDLQVIGSLLAKAGSKIPQAAAPRPVVPGQGHPRKKKSSGAAGTLFAGLALVVGVAAFLHFTRRPPPPPGTARPGVVVLPSVSHPPRTDNPGTSPDPGKGSETVPAPPPVAQDPPVEAPPAPAVDPGVPVAPKADVPAFLANARKIMQGKARGPISDYVSKMRGNVSGYQSDAGRGAAKMKAEDRTKLQAALGEEINGWKASGNRIPAEVPPAIADIPGIQTLHADYLNRQTGFETSFNQAIDKFADTYVLGLQLQLDRYKKAEDPGAADSVGAEIKETKADPAYFRTLMATPPGAGQ